VLDADEWLVRIVLDGIQGPLHVGGADWNQAMPAFRGDPRLDDGALAGLATYLRRAFGHVADAVEPETVARIRAATAERAKPWTHDELVALDVPHRLDRYTGRFRIDGVPLTLEIAREGMALRMGVFGMGEGLLREEGDGRFTVANPSGPGEIAIEFAAGESGSYDEVVMLRPAGDRLTWRRVVGDAR
jgi:hypothetical protein